MSKHTYEPITDPDYWNSGIIKLASEVMGKKDAKLEVAAVLPVVTNLIVFLLNKKSITKNTRRTVEKYLWQAEECLIRKNPGHMLAYILFSFAQIGLDDIELTTLSNALVLGTRKGGSHSFYSKYRKKIEPFLDEYISGGKQSVFIKQVETIVGRAPSKDTVRGWKNNREDGRPFWEYWASK